MKLLATQQKFSLYVANLIKYIYENGYSCTLGDAFRSSEQAAIYAYAGIGIRDSQHCKRLAIDINLFSPDNRYLTSRDDYEIFGIYWESLDPICRWGGNFKRADSNHFEIREEK
jgi:hypothetical protein